MPRQARDERTTLQKFAVGFACRRSEERTPHYGLLPTFDLDSPNNIMAWNRIRLYLLVRKDAFFGAISYTNRVFYQDRLRTNIGKVEKTRRVFPADVRL